MSKEHAAKINEEHYNNWIDYKFSYAPYVSELEAIISAEDPYNRLRFGKVPTFTIPLPEIDMNLVKSECMSIMEQQDNQWEYKAVDKYPDYKDWRMIPLYRAVGIKDMNATRFDNKNSDYEFVYDTTRYTELTKLIDMHAPREAPIWLSVLEPGGMIGLHTDVDQKDPKLTLTKSRLPIQFPEHCAMVVEGSGKVDFYSDELAYFNYKVPHGVYNKSNELKVDIAISLILKTPEQTELVQEAIRNKCRKLLDEV
jgi:hypothetical protein